MSQDGIRAAVREVAAHAKRNAGPGISLRRLQDHMQEIEEPTIVFKNTGGEYVTLGIWIPARVLGRATGR